jgi:NADPH2:quinone reductase
VKVWRVRQFGSPTEVLELQDVPVPEPGEDEALVRVLAANIGLPDLMMTEGRYFMTPSLPISPGQEMVGIVEAAGPRYPFAIGDRIIGLTRFSDGFGGLGEYCLSPGDGAVLAPQTMSDEQAASFLGTAHVAYVGLHDRARLLPGETLLVLGGSGGAGSTAIQIGKAMGARVIATARGDKKVDFCSKQGADQVIDLSVDNLVDAVDALTEGSGVDVVYDTVGGPLIEDAFKSLRIGGRLVLIGFAGAQGFSEISALDILISGVSVTGALHTVRTAEERDGASAQLNEWHARGRISIPVVEVCDFLDAPKAIETMGKSAMGKTIVHLAGPANQPN